MHGQNVSQSPTPSRKAETLMDFPSAISAVVNGARISKLEWNDPECFGMLRDGFLMLRRDGQWHQWIVNDGDLLGQDWVVVEYGHHITQLSQ